MEIGRSIPESIHDKRDIAGAAALSQVAPAEHNLVPGCRSKFSAAPYGRASGGGALQGGRGTAGSRSLTHPHAFSSYQKEYILCLDRPVIDKSSEALHSSIAWRCMQNSLLRRKNFMAMHDIGWCLALLTHHSCAPRNRKVVSDSFCLSLLCPAHTSSAKTL